MWANFFWLCKGTNDDGQLQATTVLIQVFLQKYYILLVFLSIYSLQEACTVDVKQGVSQKKTSTLKGQEYFYIYI
jgi:hypothetical protein